MTRCDFKRPGKRRIAAGSFRGRSTYCDGLFVPFTRLANNAPALDQPASTTVARSTAATMDLSGSDADGDTWTLLVVLRLSYHDI